ncbi:MAG: methionyl-tRNA formyltransferase [Bryobacteraceae bacterium]|nr:methionyl-tRNA formyltransferase [Bryobacteraceae bacterium]
MELSRRPLRAIFMGTPAFAVPTLDAMIAAGHDVVAVYTQPDRPKGRGQQVQFSPVKEAAVRHNLPVRQPERIRRPENVEELRSDAVDVMVVVGYGQIIPQAIIDLPRHGIVNVHASLLPKYRGAAPIQWAVANGETVTGVTTMLINSGLDTGDMLLKAETPVGPEETALDISPRLAADGARLLLETLARMEAGTLVRIPQNDAEATLAPILKKEDGRIDWTWPASEIANRCRGFLPWPGTWTTFREQMLHIWRAKPANDISLGISGSVQFAGRRMLVACGGGTALEIEELQLEGRKRVNAEAFRNGQRLTQTEKLGENIN